MVEGWQPADSKGQVPDGRRSALVEGSRDRFAQVQGCPPWVRTGWLFTTGTEHYSDEFIMEPISDPAAHGELHGHFNVIKLHVSFNWRTADGRRALVMGTQKSGQIAASPLLFGISTSLGKYSQLAMSG